MTFVWCRDYDVRRFYCCQYQQRRYDADDGHAGWESNDGKTNG